MILQDSGCTMNGRTKSQASHGWPREASNENTQVLDSPQGPLQNRASIHIFFCLAKLLSRDLLSPGH